jgi:hypothetical protein
MDISIFPADDTMELNYTLASLLSVFSLSVLITCLLSHDATCIKQRNSRCDVLACDYDTNAMPHSTLVSVCMERSRTPVETRHSHCAGSISSL